MAIPAEALERTHPEQIPVALVRHNVIGDHSSHDQSLLKAEGAKRMHPHLKFLLRFPTPESVPGARIARAVRHI
jgi:hypothetical protein